MPKVMTNTEFVDKLIDIVNTKKTLYVLGAIGSPLTDANKSRYINNHCSEYNGQTTRKNKIMNADKNTFGFDCVCLIKSVLWGWNGDVSKTYGGATYASNGVPDIGADSIINVCSNVSTDFKNVEVGELVWKTGHVGIYIGEGLVIECTPIWDDGVQITACNSQKPNYHSRYWTKHGKLPYIDYAREIEEPKEILTVIQSKTGIQVSEPARAIAAMENARKSNAYLSLYWLLRKIANSIK